MKRLLIPALVLSLVFSFAAVSSATNGDNLISIGPISRAMGGVGIAAPQDSISAVFSNPAAMCFGPYCPGSGFDFAGSIFMPSAHTRIQIPAFNYDTGSQKSDSDIFVIPAIGISSPISQKLRFGLAAYGVSGLGVDYRDKINLMGNTVYTNLQILKFAPNLAYMISPNFSVGAAIHIDYGSLDLHSGTSSNFGFGVQLGAIYKAGPFSFGGVYISPQKINHKNVANFDEAYGSTSLDDLKLQSPAIVGFGVAFEPVQDVLLIETDAKWLNWSDADGYKDFNWRDQWVFSIGAQYKPTPKFALRAGFNYGKNPVKTDTLSASSPPIDVQGSPVPQFQYEVLRVSGFPAIVQSHLTAGVGYKFSKSFSVNLAYLHAFKNTLTESGTAMLPDGQGGYVAAPVNIQADLSEDSIDFGLTWTF